MPKYRHIALINKASTMGAHHRCRKRATRREMFLDTVLGSTLAAWMAPLLPSQKSFYLYLICAFVIAGATWLYFSHREESARPDGIEKGLLGYIFDPAVWFHRSARQDYLYFILNALVFYGIVAQLLVSGHVFFNAFGSALDWAFGVRDAPIFAPSPLTAAAYTLAVVLAIDLAVWTTHYLQHKIVLLWQFHQVHHSAEVLTPVTVYRMHPVDLFFTGIVTTALIGLAFAGFTYLTQSEPAELVVMNVNVLLFTFYLVGYNLRHSHIWLSYPRWLSHILISPAMHQVHHSIDPRHWDRNMGLIFAFWDWLFGTLYVAVRYEKLEFGVSRAEPNPFESVVDIYLKPFRLAWAHLTGGVPNLARRLGIIALIGAVTVGTATLRNSHQVAASDRALPTVSLQDLTWTEVDRALADGYDTVIIPTGGTEQNGPHVILGKHNYIVDETARRIAQRLGRTLVAPAIAHVPEGDTGQTPTGHMRWAGTVSLPQDVFEAVLEHTARSLSTHGFTRIVFIGDSGGNQAAQASVADRLSREWRDVGVTVLHISSYYAANGQRAALEAEGYDFETIGEHAGIRDTSELLAVHPDGVRRNPVPPRPGTDPGYNGVPSKASAQIGERMLELKVKAALAQIEALTTKVN
jgi:creatinine amidohydrolase/Fe(II)-dependent formamide hydrolase-like protein/sterol desaturase/sphingolipid hydroxylase (fatty acid hydroxylase superfamily)